MNPISEHIAAIQSQIKPGRDRLRAALSVVDAEIAALREAGLSVTVDWPYGRGATALASSTKIEVQVSL